MDITHYLNIFEKAAKELADEKVPGKQFTVATGMYFESAFLKLYKTSWANPSPDLLTSPSRIFFSIWTNENAIGKNRLLYNIHALKLRQLNGYSLKSKAFAADFRAEFKRFEKHWPNVTTDFGPLTLMEGWLKLSNTSLQADSIELSLQFLKIAPVIDELLAKNKVNKC